MVFFGAPVRTELTKYLGLRHFQAHVLYRNLRMLVSLFILEGEGNLFILFQVEEYLMYQDRNLVFCYCRKTLSEALNTTMVSLEE